MINSENASYEKYQGMECFDYFIASCQKTMTNSTQKEVSKLIRLLVVNHDIADFKYGTLLRLRAHLNNICNSKLERHEYEGFFMTAYLLSKIRAIISHYSTLIDVNNMEG